MQAYLTATLLYYWEFPVDKPNYVCRIFGCFWRLPSKLHKWWHKHCSKGKLAIHAEHKCFKMYVLARRVVEHIEADLYIHFYIIKDLLS